MDKGKMVIAIAATVLALSGAVPGIAQAKPPATAERQPEMVAAYKHLEAAKSALERASADKGGHRAKAIELVNQAMAETEKGAQYANKH